MTKNMEGPSSFFGEHRQGRLQFINVRRGKRRTSWNHRPIESCKVQLDIIHDRVHLAFEKNFYCVGRRELASM